MVSILGEKLALEKAKTELERTRAELTQTRTELIQARAALIQARGECDKALNNVLRLSMELAASHDKTRTARQCAAALREAIGANIKFPWEGLNNE